MSWDLIIEPGRKYSHTALDSSFHVSQAIILYTSNATDEDITVIVDYEGQEFILCHLDETHSQERLDLNFQKGTSISLFTRGQEYVHLTGYYLGDDDDEDDNMTLDEKKAMKHAKHEKNAKAAF